MLVTMEDDEYSHVDDSNKDNAEDERPYFCVPKFG
jgi:hypothetical protein